LSAHILCFVKQLQPQPYWLEHFEPKTKALEQIRRLFPEDDPEKRLPAMIAPFTECVGIARLWRRLALVRVAAGAAAALALLAHPVFAQTDYYNTDMGRPIRIEDAYPVERRAFEIQAAPLRLERARGGVYHWGIEPELAFGILPRTQIEIGFPLAFVDGGGERTTGLAGVDVSALYNLNAETSIPALAIAAGVILPAGGLAPDEAYASVKGIATRTFSWARFHVNGEYTFGSRPTAAAGESAGAAELSRWMAGLAVDRTFPLRSMLVTTELFAREPIVEGEAVQWNTGAGIRYQLRPRWAIDAGVGGRLTGDDRGWYVTFGGAYAFGLPWSR
jgi:hypothetical protein